MLFGFCVAVLVLAILLGGGTSSGFLGDVVIQVAAVQLLCLALWPVLKGAGWDGQRRAIGVVVLPAVAATALQVLPLPLHIWSGGEAILARDGATGIVGSRAWDTLSLTPEATWAAAVSLLVPIAIFCAAVRLNFQQRETLCWVVLGLGALSLMIGFLQVAQGPGSSLRFYSHTNLTEAVGFFANRNHFAALLVVCLVLIGYWVTTARVEVRRSSANLLLWAAVALVSVAFMAGLMMARSRAAVSLAMLVIGGVAAVFYATRKGEVFGRDKRTPAKAVVMVAIVAMLLAMQFGLGRLLTRFEEDSVDSLRIRFAGAAVHTAMRSLPFGTGLGSFVPVYGAVEASDQVRPSYANRAHNDFAEIFLETGIPGAILVLGFVAWFLRRSWAVWRAPPGGEATRVTALNRTAMLIVAVLILHSLVDYPLRTTASAAIFAFFCGVLAVPATCEPVTRPRQQRNPRHSGEKVRREAWTGEVSWPEKWRKTAPS
ncbi:O-antigen polymerase [Rhodomicrobium vannielii ATCC 17100]|uniref:O-antigen polymerase n=1 Tax=Rhodomicrobium vannielii (strain ATCC 17100 / DSM 162 / LMG 4299 / NCIMB 10020 / ATH 3.1.1) TaxID=648757 RepID=E3I850_RHOVT|nr:O-antigen polymerase [Rhodomicrobium vannielii ATCC 17100]